jgi:non-ribosomal peptide synthase protein (TIGR01720 family)
VDRAALPAPGHGDGDTAAGSTGPRTATETILVEVWGQVLRRERIGVEDNFFELGGDSISSISVVSRAREAGVHVTVAQMFDHQTVAALAAVATTGSGVLAEQEPERGNYPLTPIQRWFLGRKLDAPEHYTQSMVLQADAPVDVPALRLAAAALVGHHDALLSRFRWDGRDWSAEIAEPGAVPLDRLVAQVPVPADVTDEWAWMDAAAQEVQGSLDLGAGPLIRFTLFERGHAHPVLLVVVHHLCVDAVSWTILLQDLASAYAQARERTAIGLPARTTSFPRWAGRLVETAASASVVDELAYWRSLAGTSHLPQDGEGPNRVDDSAWVSVTLDAERTSQLLNEVPAAYRTQINDVLLAALATTLTGWVRSPSVVVDLEGHGREDVGDDVDVSRTVGWFTSVHPVRLHAGADPGEVLRRTKDDLRAVPRHGLGYGLLRYLTPSDPVAPAVPASPAQVSFNYLGQTSRALDSGGPFRPTGRSLGRAESGANERTHLLEINGQVHDDRLELVWTFGRLVHDEATVARLARRFLQCLTELIEHCLRAGAGGSTPSDFPLAGLDQSALDQLRQRFESGGAL